MIIIISPETDYSTTEVHKWLLKFEQNVFVILEKNFVQNVSISFETEDSQVTLFFYDENTIHRINLDDVKSIWYRKHDLSFFDDLDIDIDNIEIDKGKLTSFLWEEISSIKEFVFYKLKQKMLIGNFEIGECNKLISFEIAQKIGLKIPKMLISSFQNELREFSTKNGSLIVKPIEDAYNCISGDYHESCSYGIFQFQKKLKNSDRVFPSVLQNCIDKKADIRVFFFFGEFYSMIIFSQNCEETKIDFRNYSEENPNRMMPCELPEKIQTKLSNLMSRLNLNSGSIDLILDVNDDFIFLEINPAGQFGMVSIPCNYHLEKRISKKLAYYE